MCIPLFFFMASLHPLFTHAAAPCSFHYKHPIFICNILYFITQWDSWFPFPFFVVTWDLSDRTPGQQLNSAANNFMIGLLSEPCVIRINWLLGQIVLLLSSSESRFEVSWHQTDISVTPSRQKRGSEGWQVAVEDAVSRSDCTCTVTDEQIWRWTICSPCQLWIVSTLN